MEDAFFYTVDAVYKQHQYIKNIKLHIVTDIKDVLLKM